METADFQRAIIHLPDSIIDFFKTNIFPGTDSRNLNPVGAPANPAAGIDVSNLKTIGIDERKDLPRHRARGGSIDGSRRLLVEGLVGTLVVELIPEPVEATLLSGHTSGRRPSRIGFEGPVHAFVPAILLRLARLDELRKDSQPYPPGGE